ncbi:MAG: putative bifunctional diguanylate cyclase/phosphodiesterase, partial [Stellaceae bacterium]
RELAMQDPLTGLPNRRQFTDALNTAIDAPPGAGATHALFILDLNRFKQVNDVFGHGTGDEVLIEVGTRLLAVMRTGDLVARLGGDEFAILAHHLAGAEAATGIALRAIEAFAAPFATGGVAHYLGVAIGIAVFPFAGSTGEEIMRRADVALYKAKAGESSGLRFFDDEMDRHVRERERLERELRSAIPDGEIEPFFQPLVDLKTRAVTGFEAVPHWNHKEIGDIPPARFMSIAEDSGLIRDLADRLLRRACQVARDWPRDVILAFNVSPVLLKDPTFGLRVLGILGETGLPTGQLEIEIAENALARDLETAKAVLGPLRGAGVQIVLDDFGTGYTSLYHLRNFKVDKIKIAGSFVARMGAERESAEIVNALIGLGRGLGFTVTADGVDGTAEGAKLSAHGCAQGQGMLFGGAMPAGETAACFASRQVTGAAGRSSRSFVLP